MTLPAAAPAAKQGGSARKRFTSRRAKLAERRWNRPAPAGKSGPSSPGVNWGGRSRQRGGRGR
eukprot:11210020-Lingulodinium_polyedra.AAC.1